MLIESRPPSDPELAALVVAQQRELRELGRCADGRGFTPYDDVRHLIGVQAGRAVACGAVRPVDGETAELTRLYVRPAYRGRGLGRQLLGALEELALWNGHTVLRLETGRHLTRLVGLYVSAGYAEIPGYGDYLGNPHRICFEKRMPVPA